MKQSARKLVVVFLLLASSLLLLAPHLADASKALDPSIGIVAPGAARGGAGPNGSNASPFITPSGLPKTGNPVSSATCAADPKFLALTSKSKKDPYAFGNPVIVRKGHEWEDTMRKLQEFAYQDLIGAGAVNAAFDGDFTRVGNRPINYNSNHRIWCQEVDRMLKMARAATFSIEPVPAGTPTVVMEEQMGDIPAVLRSTKTSSTGKAAVFTFDGRQVMLLLDRHFQPVQTAAFDVNQVPPL